jgi:hypothetical protein
MNVGSRLVHGLYEKLHETIDLDVVVAVIGDFKGVIKENVSWKSANGQ